VRDKVSFLEQQKERLSVFRRRVVRAAAQLGQASTVSRLEEDNMQRLDWHRRRVVVCDIAFLWSTSASAGILRT